MQYLDLMDKSWAANQMAIMVAAPSARRTHQALAAALFLLTGAIQVQARNRSAAGYMVVPVYPEKTFEAKAGSVVLKIRLASGGTSLTWAPNSCTRTSRPSYIVTESGGYETPFGALTPDISWPHNRATWMRPPMDFSMIRCASRLLGRMPAYDRMDRRLLTYQAVRWLSGRHNHHIESVTVADVVAEARGEAFCPWEACVTSARHELNAAETQRGAPQI